MTTFNLHSISNVYPGILSFDVHGEAPNYVQFNMALHFVEKLRRVSFADLSVN